MRSDVIDALEAADEPPGWEALVAATGADDERKLDKTIEELQADDVIRYSGRQGGYVLAPEVSRDDADV